MIDTYDWNIWYKSVENFDLLFVDIQCATACLLEKVSVEPSHDKWRT